MKGKEEVVLRNVNQVSLGTGILRDKQAEHSSTAVANLSDLGPGTTGW